MTNTADPSRGLRLGTSLAGLALACGGLCALAALVAGPAYRAELLSLGAGLQTIRWAATGAVAGATFALLALVVLLSSGARRGIGSAGVALVLNALVAGPPLYLYESARSLPHIHDVSTDTADPPAFVAVIALRSGARNPVDYDAATAARQQRGYPDIVPLTLQASPAQAFAHALAAAHEMGWQIVAASPKDLRIEATATSLLFGFKDDVVVRIRPEPQGSIVDVRSLSRVGGSDFGVNAKRIRVFLRKLAGTTDRPR